MNKKEKVFICREGECISIERNSITTDQKIVWLPCEKHKYMIIMDNDNKYYWTKEGYDNYRESLRNPIDVTNNDFLFFIEKRNNIEISRWLRVSAIKEFIIVEKVEE